MAVVAATGTSTLTRALNVLGLWWISFHPIMKFRKVSKRN